MSIIGVTVGTPINPQKIADDLAPTIDVADITGGHQLTITDKNGTKVFDVMDGKDGAGGGGAPADWNASEGEAGHVLNRTHYALPDEILVSNADIVAGEDGEMYCEITPLNLPMSEYSGKEFAITLNGVEYTRSPLYLDEDSGEMLFLGNYEAVLGTGDNGDTFVFGIGIDEGVYMGVLFMLDGSTSAQLSVTVLGDCKELDKKFIKTAVNELTGDYAFSFTGAEEGTDVGGTTITAISGTEYVMTSGDLVEKVLGKICRFNLPYRGNRYDFYPTFSRVTHSTLKKAMAVVPYHLNDDGASWVNNSQWLVIDVWQATESTAVVGWKFVDQRWVEGFTYNPAWKGKILAYNANGGFEPIALPETGIDKSSITLGVHTDGLVYVFVDGTPCGTGISITAGGSTDVVGNVDENNNIVITGYLPNGEYTLKYAYADGTTSEVGNFVVGNPTPSPSYKNLANPSDAAWYTNKRLNSSGVLTDVTDEQRGTDTVVMTNLFDISSATIIHVKGLDIMNKTAGGQNYGRVYLYDDTGAYVHYNQPSASSVEAFSTADYDDSVTLIDVASLKSGHGYKLGEGRSFKYFALGGILTGTADDVTITADQQIV